MPTCWLNAALLSASLLAGTAVVLDSVSPPIPSQCNQKLDGFCANASDPDLRTCYAMLRRRGEKLPMLAGLSGPCYIPGHCTARWHCYSPSDLVGPDPASLPVEQRKFKGSMCWPNGTGVCNCSRALLQVLDGCESTAGGPTVEVFKAVAVIPALVFAPPSPALPNGTLVAFSEGCGAGPRGQICSRRSTDSGATFGELLFPVSAAGLPAKPGPSSGWAQPQAAYDPRTKTILLQFTNESSVKGGCDNHEESLGGVLQVSSTDFGLTWGRFVDVQRQIASSSTSCLAPTSGQGLSMRPINGRYGGRLVFCAVRNPYQGDVPVYSDDGGVTYNYSTGVDLPGMDECNIAQGSNGSLYLIARNCDKANLGQCGMLTGGGRDRGSSSSVGSHLFAVSVSDDGGETWGPISHQPQLITPVCQASIISHQGPHDAAPALYFSGPYSNHTRRNGTILASDDNGITFSRSLNVFPYANGTFGYSSIACGMVAENDCGVLFDNGDRLIFLPFRSGDVKAAIHSSDPTVGNKQALKTDDLMMDDNVVEQLAPPTAISCAQAGLRCAVGSSALDSDSELGLTEVVHIGPERRKIFIGSPSIWKLPRLEIVDV